MHSDRPVYIKQAGTHGWRLLVWVQPRAKKSGCAGLYGDRLKIKVAAPPVDHKANQELIGFVAKTLGRKNRDVRVISGETGRKKDLLIEGLEEPCWDGFTREDAKG